MTNHTTRRKNVRIEYHPTRPRQSRWQTPAGYTNHGGALDALQAAGLTRQEARAKLAEIERDALRPLRDLDGWTYHPRSPRGRQWSAMHDGRRVYLHHNLAVRVLRLGGLTVKEAIGALDRVRHEAINK